MQLGNIWLTNVFSTLITYTLKLQAHNLPKMAHELLYKCTQETAMILAPCIFSATPDSGSLYF